MVEYFESAGGEDDEAEDEDETEVAERVGEARERAAVAEAVETLGSACRLGRMPDENWSRLCTGWVIVDVELTEGAGRMESVKEETARRRRQREEKKRRACERQSERERQ